MNNRNWLRGVGGGLRWLAALLICSVILLPIVWVLSISLKPPEEWVAYPPTVIPVEPTASNYIVLFQPGNPVGGISAMVSSAEPVTKAFINSLIIVPVSTLASLLIGFFAAYSVSRFRTGGPTLPLFVLTTRMFPPVAFAVPLLVYYRLLGLIDTQLGLILMYTGFTIAFSLWMMRGFIDGVPRHVEEAAILDGASPWRVLFTITLPLVRGGLAATGLFVFILNWTEFLFAQIFTTREAITIPVQVSHYVGAVGRFYGPMAALGVVASIPVVIAGYLIQRHLVTGFTFGLVRE
jgi:multiple sugar transport system permease protein